MKPIYQVKEAAALAKDAWSNDQDKEALFAKIKTGKYSIWDMYKFKCLIGNEAVLKSLAQKILPDMLHVQAEIDSTNRIEHVDASTELLRKEYEEKLKKKYE